MDVHGKRVRTDNREFSDKTASNKLSYAQQVSSNAIRPYILLTSHMLHNDHVSYNGGNEER